MRAYFIQEYRSTIDRGVVTLLLQSTLNSIVADDNQASKCPSKTCDVNSI
jgi:hypothetical protein